MSSDHNRTYFSQSQPLLTGSDNFLEFGEIKLLQVKVLFRAVPVDVQQVILTVSMCLNIVSNDQASVSAICADADRFDHLTGYLFSDVYSSVPTHS